MWQTKYRKPKRLNTEPWGIPHVASETVALFLWLFYFDSLILFLYFCISPLADVSRGSMTSLLVQPISAFLAKTLLSSPATGRGDSCVPIAMPRNAGKYICFSCCSINQRQQENYMYQDDMQLHNNQSYWISEVLDHVWFKERGLVTYCGVTSCAGSSLRIGQLSGQETSNFIS